MSAAQWRKAMNSGARAGVAAASREAALSPVANTPDVTTRETSFLRDGTAPRWLEYLRNTLEPRHVFIGLFVLLYPWFASPFFTFQIGGQSLVLGLIALSLTFLAGYGGMVSMAQMTVAGMAGYGVAIFGTSGTQSISLGWPWWLAVLLAVGLATILATAIGWLSVRTEGIYTIMITLAIGVAFFYFAQQNYDVFNGFQGFQNVQAPVVFGVNWKQPIPFYYLALGFALAGYFLVKYVSRTPFGIALQGIRDNPRRMNALGFDVVAHRVAAYALAGFIAAVGGVLLVWYNGLITPGTIGTGAMINILIIAVLGGLKHPIGAFVGAIVFVLVQNFAIDFVERERFNLVIGGVFLVIVLFSTDGLLGWYRRIAARLAANQAPKWDQPRPAPHNTKE